MKMMPMMTMMWVPDDVDEMNTSQRPRRGVIEGRNPWGHVKGDLSQIVWQPVSPFSKQTADDLLARRDSTGHDPGKSRRE
jgi:hypothetical protein